GSPAGQPSTTTPTPFPCVSPHVVTRNNVPNVEPAMLCLPVSNQFCLIHFLYLCPITNSAYTFPVSDHISHCILLPRLRRLFPDNFRRLSRRGSGIVHRRIPQQHTGTDPPV